MKTTSSKAVILAGFIAILLLQLCVMLAWYGSERYHNQWLADIEGKQREQQLMAALRDAVLKRSIALFRMAEVAEDATRDREFNQFVHLERVFNQASNELVSGPGRRRGQDDQTRQLWERLSPVVMKGTGVQNEAAELIRSGRRAEAERFLRYTVIPVQESVISALTALSDAGEVAVETDLLRARDSGGTIFTFMILFGAGSAVAVVGICAYVLTRTGRAEAALREQTQHMEQLKDLAESSSRSKSAFLANMSHEIRTPLTAIIGFSESLLEQSLTASDRVTATQTVIRCGKHLLQVINDILDLSKIEAEKLHIETIPVDVFQIVADVGSLASVQATGKGIAFSVDYEFPLPASIVSDPVRVKQILFNLVGNAVKFTSSGGVRVRVGYSAATNQMRFDVIDTGVGLSDAQKQNLFQAFNQADATTTRRFGGTGLGLHLSRTLCDRLGGSIAVESTEGVGSIFTATFSAGPSAPPKMVNQAPASVERAAAVELVARHSGKVLLVDDVAENRQLIALYLRKMGATVSSVENGLHAVSSALGESFDLILMDMQMPVMDGIEATALLRQRGYTGPIVALTANVMSAEVDRCLKAGCDGFLGKPVDRNEFAAVVGKYLAAAQSPDAPIVRSNLTESEPELEELVERFVGELHRYVDELAASLRDMRWADLAQRLHDFKSMSGNYGFPQLSRLAADAEQQLKGARYDDVHDSIGRIAAIARQVKQPSPAASGRAALAT
jgi:signal transduction histidine kinase/CheY-like chemotaxis protein